MCFCAHPYGAGTDHVSVAVNQEAGFVPRTAQRFWFVNNATSRLFLVRDGRIMTYYLGRMNARFKRVLEMFRTRWSREGVMYRVGAKLEGTNIGASLAAHCWVKAGFYSQERLHKPCTRLTAQSVSSEDLITRPNVLSRSVENARGTHFERPSFIGTWKYSIAF